MTTFNENTQLDLGRCDGGVKNVTVVPWPKTSSTLQQVLQDVKVGEKDGSYFTCGSFKNNHRDSANSNGGSVFVLDGDKTLVEGKKINGAPDPQLVHAVLKKLDITHLIYTSHSNAENYHRYRVVIPCKWVGKDELTAIVGWTIQQLHKADVLLANVGENTNVACAWFLPRTNDIALFNSFDYMGGVFPKEDALQWVDVKKAAAQNHDAQHTCSDFPIEKAQAALGHIECSKLEYDEWLHIGMALHHAYGEDGFSLWDDWSQTDIGRYDKDKTCRNVWDSFTIRDIDPVTIGTLIYIAKKHGYTGLASLEDLKAQFDAIDSDNEAVLGEFVRGLHRESAIVVDKLLRYIKLKTGISIGTLKSEVDASRRQSIEDSDDDEPNTHLTMGQSFIDSYDGNIVASRGNFHVCDDSYLWNKLAYGNAQLMLAKTFDGHALCRRANDYIAITKMTYTLNSDSEFFDDAIPRICCVDTVYTVDEHGEVIKEPLAKEHRMQWRFDVEPSFKEPKMLVDALNFAFDNEEDQMQLAQQLIGLIVFKKLNIKKKAWWLYGPGGNNGKTMVMNLLVALVGGPSRCSAVSPLSWGNDTDCFAMADSILNTVGELPDNKLLDGNMFKMIVGGKDYIQAKELYKDKFHFLPTASQVFASNKLIPTTEKGAPFYNRWAVSVFKNMVPEDDQIDHYEEHILDAELAEVIGWCITGVKSYMKTGFVETKAQSKVMAEWKIMNNSALEFIYDEEHVTLDKALTLKRDALYDAYTAWCSKHGRQALGIKKFLSELVSHGAIAHKRDSDGIWWYYGVGLYLESSHVLKGQHDI